MSLDRTRENARPLPVAVIIVCRNALPALRQTMQSLQALNEPRLLPIIIDGASTDGTATWLSEVADSTFHASSEPDQGIYDAMNKGWAAAPADAFVLYLGAGDMLYGLPDDSHLRDPKGDPWPLVLGNTLIGNTPYRSRWGRELRLRNTAHHQSMMLHKSVSPDPPFDAQLRVYADWDFNLRLYGRGIKAVFVPSLRSYALPGGASWSMDVAEITRVARRHGGPLTGALSWILNTLSRWKRFRHKQT